MTASAQAQPRLLFQKARVRDRDQAVFTVKLVVALSLAGLSGHLALSSSLPVTLLGMVLLGAVYTHMVELQHQCLHHSAFRSARLHRVVGVPLGVPLLVSYSHYRVRHLQHHRYLGTPRDSEFFGFDARQPLTWGLLLRGLLDYPRLLVVLKDIAASCTGRWSYDLGQIAERRRRDIIAEYRLLGLVLLVTAVAAAAGHADLVLRLWLIPLLFAIPLHFLVELPEHLLCDTETADVLHNTRSIRGSWLTTWFTNGNNLHIEHHAAMAVPINRLPERHAEVQEHATHVERGYFGFFKRTVTAVRESTQQVPQTQNRERTPR